MASAVRASLRNVSLPWPVVRSRVTLFLLVFRWRKRRLASSSGSSAPERAYAPCRITLRRLDLYNFRTQIGQQSPAKLTLHSGHIQNAYPV